MTEEHEDKEEKVNDDAILIGIRTAERTINNFIDKRYTHDNRSLWLMLLIVFFLITAIVILALYDKISETTTGTLMGSIIGYSIGKFVEMKRGRDNSK